MAIADPPVLCRKCGKNEVPPRLGTHKGRPRTTCLECTPPSDSVAKREGYLRWKKNREKKKLEENRFRFGVCNCGRDYLQVPLEEAHLCINPRPYDYEGNPV